ncbi:MAG: hypothetical protein RMY62_001040 [Nostoc sp. ZfuVER08]|jgi:hypothetical protein|nr:hypothetical protein [Nostoc sp. ZfuVER08]
MISLQPNTIWDDAEQKTLTRRIITFRKTGEYYRRDDEVHHQRLYDTATITNALQQVGFGVQSTHSYGEYKLSPGHAVFIARRLS